MNEHVNPNVPAGEEMLHEAEEKKRERKNKANISQSRAVVKTIRLKD